MRIHPTQVAWWSNTVFRAVSSLHPLLASRPALHHEERGETYDSSFDGAVAHTYCAVLCLALLRNRVAVGPRADCEEGK